MMVNIWSCGNIIRWNINFGPKILLDTADSGLSPLYLRQLFDKLFAVCAQVPLFWSTMFKLSLYKLLSAKKKYRRANTHTTVEL